MALIYKRLSVWVSSCVESIFSSACLLLSHARPSSWGGEGGLMVQIFLMTCCLHGSRNELQASLWRERQSRTATSWNPFTKLRYFAAEFADNPSPRSFVSYANGFKWHLGLFHFQWRLAQTPLEQRTSMQACIAERVLVFNTQHLSSTVGLYPFLSNNKKKPKSKRVFELN